MNSKANFTTKKKFTQRHYFSWDKKGGKNASTWTHHVARITRGEWGIGEWGDIMWLWGDDDITLVSSNLLELEKLSLKFGCQVRLISTTGTTFFFLICFPINALILLSATSTVSSSMLAKQTLNQPGSEQLKDDPGDTLSFTSWMITLHSFNSASNVCSLRRLFRFIQQNSPALLGNRLMLTSSSPFVNFSCLFANLLELSARNLCSQRKMIQFETQTLMYTSRDI